MVGLLPQLRTYSTTLHVCPNSWRPNWCPKQTQRNETKLRMKNHNVEKRSQTFAAGAAGNRKLYAEILILLLWTVVKMVFYYLSSIPIYLRSSSIQHAAHVTRSRFVVVEPSGKGNSRRESLEYSYELRVRLLCCCVVVDGDGVSARGTITFRESCSIYISI